MSKLKVNELDTKTGTTLTVTTGKTLDIPAGGTISVAGTQTVTGAQTNTGALDISGATVTLPATLPATALTNATNIPAAQLSGQVPTANLGNVDTSGLEADIALLAFKTQANGSLARYNLIDQSVDSFEDATGVDAGASTGENRSASNYYFGGTAGSAATVSFTTPGATTWTAPQGLTTLTHVLVQAGGGGGGGAYEDWTSGGGGGGGGTVYQANRSVVGNTTYNLTVGAGGAGGASGGNAGTNGVNSIFDTITANGGGGGSAYGQAGTAGGNGGGGARGTPSPGVAGNQADSGGGTGYNASYGGNGQAYSNNSNNAAGGGGGSGGGGANSNGGTGGGAGGVGRDWSPQFSTSIGESGWFGGGGGGGAQGAPAAAGGNGGGGDGGQNNVTAPSGLANTGGGGGGGVNNNVAVGGTPGGVGGSGAVHIKYDAFTAEGGNMTLVSNAQTAAAGAPTKGDLVMTISNGAGTTTLNTDVKAYISRDGSAYTSAVTLLSKGTTGGHEVLTASDVDLSGIATGTSMRWKVETLNQSVSKTTRIQAVSLGWS